MGTECAGPNNTLAMEVNDKLAIRIYAREGRIDLTFYLAEGQRMQIAQPEILIMSQVDEANWRKQLPYIQYDVLERFKSEEELGHYIHQPVAIAEQTKSYLVRNLPSVGTVLNASYVFPADTEFVGRPGLERSILALKFQSYSSYMTFFDTSDIHSEQVVLKLPIISINGTVVSVPDVTIKKVTEYVFYTFC
jgi:hypothetical protein